MGPCDGGRRRPRRRPARAHAALDRPPRSDARATRRTRAPIPGCPRSTPLHGHAPGPIAPGQAPVGDVRVRMCRKRIPFARDRGAGARARDPVLEPRASSSSTARRRGAARPRPSRSSADDGGATAAPASPASADRSAPRGHLERCRGSRGRGVGGGAPPIARLGRARPSSNRPPHDLLQEERVAVRALQDLGADVVREFVDRPGATRGAAANLRG